jgi:hypothetical protein
MCVISLCTRGALDAAARGRSTAALGAMSLVTVRLGTTKKEPLSLEVSSYLLSASALLLHVEALPGVKVIAKKSWALTDDFEAYFTYSGRLFVMNTPFSKVWISLIGQPADEGLFKAVEAQAQSYSWLHSFLSPLAFAKYFFLPLNPPQNILEQHESADGA